MKRTHGRWVDFLLTMLVLGAATRTVHADGQRFRAEDPLASERDASDASTVRPLETSSAIAGLQAVRNQSNGSHPAMNLNTISEVRNSGWFTNRIGHEPLSLPDLARGPNRSVPPSGPWIVLAGKTDGVTPGLRLKDAAGRTFFVKFDPPGHPEMASGAEVVSTKLLFALGYWVPENYIATMRRGDLSLAPQATFKGPDGRKRPMTTADIDEVLKHAARSADGGFRMVASLSVEGQPIGPFRYSGTRLDDRNDIVPHEDRRELRALRVFAAWLNHVDTKSQNSLDTLVSDGVRKVVRHYLLDFGSTLGSAGTEPKDWRDGFEYAYEGRTSLLALVTLGTHTPSWRRIRYPRFPAVGRIESQHFVPEQWKPTLPNPAFQNLDDDDAFWAAQRVMAFSDDAIRAIVATAEFSDPAATTYLGDVMISRRDAIGRAWLTGVNPVVDPFVDASGQLVFRNVAQETGLTTDRATYRVRWSRFDNVSQIATPLGPWRGIPDRRVDLPIGVPASVEYLMVEIAAIHFKHPAWLHPVKAYFRRDGSQTWTLVGFERPGNQEPVAKPT